MSSRPFPPAIAKQQVEILRSTGDYLRAHRTDLRVTDIDSAVTVVWLLVDGLVHHIVFHAPAAEKDRLLDAGVDALCAYLITPTGPGVRRIGLTE